MQPTKAKVSGILLAAGGSTRFGSGQHKLLAAFKGMPLVRHAGLALCRSKLSERIIVLGAREAEIRMALAGLEADYIQALAWREGMAASLRAGMAAVSHESDAVLIMLADMPNVTESLINRLIHALDASSKHRIIRPVFAGQPGHPVLFRRCFFEALMALQGDVGARDIIRAYPQQVLHLDVETDSVLFDVDTIAALKAKLPKD